MNIFVSYGQKSKILINMHFYLIISVVVTWVVKHSCIPFELQKEDEILQKEKDIIAIQEYH